MRSILLTGATGIVGSEVLRALAPVAKVAILIRGSQKVRDEKKAWLSSWANTQHLHCLGGDITEPYCGLSVPELASLELDTIVHCAANTSFTQSAQSATLINTEGTAHILELASSLQARVIYISTAFAAGRRSGDIFEAELSTDVGFHCAYERSKFEAERLVSAADNACIVRPSIVVGRSDDGHIARLDGAYAIWRLFYKGLLAMLPGDGAQVVDLIASDILGRFIAYLVVEGFSAGQTYNACAGPLRSFTLNELFPFVGKVFEEVDPPWIGNGYPGPIQVPQSTFDDFIATVEYVGGSSLRRIVRQVKSFTAQLTTPKRFHTTHFDSALAQAGLQFSNATEWLPNLVRHALAKDWKNADWKSRGVC